MSATTEKGAGATAAPYLVSASVWRNGLYAAVAWLAAALITEGLPDIIAWGSRDLFTWLLVAGAAIFAVLSFTLDRLSPRIRRSLIHNGPWFIALGVWLALWELITAKLGLLPKPFFAPPHGLFHVYIVDWQRLLICIAFTARLWIIGFGTGIVLGFILGVALGWSKAVSYWGMPILKLIGPVPASAWIPATFFLFPSIFQASAFIVALASGIPVAILTASGVNTVSRAYYDVARTLGADERFLVLRVAIPAALPNVFVGLFMGLYYSFAVLVVAEMLGAKYGLGWYLQFQTAYSAYANVYAALIIMALVCSGLVKLLFVVRDRVLAWQKAVVQW
jgi:NitT/TauT family transport system permease protein